METGLRYDKTTYSNDQVFSPRVGVAYAFSEDTIVRGAWGYYYQSQFINDLDVNHGITAFRSCLGLGSAGERNASPSEFGHLFRGSYGRYGLRKGGRRRRAGARAAPRHIPKQLLNPAELAKHYVLGVEQRFSNGIELRVEGYYKDLPEYSPAWQNLRDHLEIFPEARNDNARVVRTGAESNGVELFAKYDRGGRFS